MKHLDVEGILGILIWVCIILSVVMSTCNKGVPESIYVVKPNLARPIPKPVSPKADHWKELVLVDVQYMEGNLVRYSKWILYFDNGLIVRKRDRWVPKPLVVGKKYRVQRGSFGIGYRIKNIKKENKQ